MLSDMNSMTSINILGKIEVKRNRLYCLLANLEKQGFVEKIPIKQERAVGLKSKYVITTAGLEYVSWFKKKVMKIFNIPLDEGVPDDNSDINDIYETFKPRLLATSKFPKKKMLGE